MISPVHVITITAFLLGTLAVNAESKLRRGQRLEGLATHASSNNNLRKLSQKCYNSKQELKDDIDWYLANPNARNELGGKHNAP